MMSGTREENSAAGSAASACQGAKIGSNGRLDEWKRYACHCRAMRGLKSSGPSVMPNNSVGSFSTSSTAGRYMLDLLRKWSAASSRRLANVDSNFSVRLFSSASYATYSGVRGGDGSSTTVRSVDP